MRPDADTPEPGDHGRLTGALSRVDDRDHERTDPPDWLWGRIAASIAAETGRASAAATAVEYTVDADDVVAAVGADWSAFAADNGAPDLAGPPAGRTLWSYFDGDEVRDLWRLLVERVRTDRRPAHVPLRCDAPGSRRWFEMTVTPGPDDSVHFRCTLVFEEERSAVSLLDPEAPRDPSAPAVPVCSWCGQAYDGSRWLDIESLVRELRLLERPVPPIDHGICPTCRDLMSTDLLVPDARSEAPG